MSFHGNTAHAGAKQNAAAQQAVRAPIASFAASTSETTDEMSVLGCPRQVVTATQAAGGNPGLTFDVQFRIDTEWLTYETFTIPVPGGPPISRTYNVAAAAMRVTVNNPAGGLSGTVVVRMHASA